MTAPTDGLVERLEGLAARCEAASGADRELDCLIFESLHPEYKPEKRGTYYGAPTGAYFDYVGDGEIDEVAHAPAYTASLDAATTLLPEGEAVFWRVGNDGEGGNPADFMAEVLVATKFVSPSFKAVAETAPLALTAACLKARAMEARNG